MEEYAPEEEVDTNEGENEESEETQRRGISGGPTFSREETEDDGDDGSHDERKTTDGPKEYDPKDYEHLQVTHAILSFEILGLLAKH